MKLDYLVNVGLSDLEFKGPKSKSIDEHFYESERYERFEKKFMKD